MAQTQTDFETLLGQVTPEQLAGDPIIRKAFIVAILANDFVLPVETSQEDQREQGGVTLLTVNIHDHPHVILFSSQARMTAFDHPLIKTGARFATVAGHAIFPSLAGQYAVLNPGPTGLILTPDDISEMIGAEKTGVDITGAGRASATPPRSKQTGCGSPGHVHGPNCSS